MRAPRRALAAGAVCAATVLALVACGGGQATPAATATTPPAATPSRPPATPLVTPSTGGTAGGPSPLLAPPASRYAATGEEVGPAFDIDSANALPLDYELYSQVGPFVSGSSGKELAASWKYFDGYVVAFDPVGLLSAVVRGSYYITVETHLFETIEGAQQAYKEYLKFYGDTPSIEPQSIAPLGNESSAWRGVGEKLGETTIDSVYHRFLFRRGNLVAQVETIGALPFMTADFAREIAVFIDNRALGPSPPPIPTPVRVPGQPTRTPQ